MKILDILLLTLLIWGAYSGFRKGFVAEVFSLAAFVLATIGSVKLMDKLTSLFQRWYSTVGNLTPYIIFVLIFITIIIAVALVGKFFKYLVNMTMLGGIDKLMGAVLGIVKWAFFVSVFLWLADLLQLEIPHSYVTNTFVFPVIKSLAPHLLGWISNWWPALQAWLERIKLTGRPVIVCLLTCW